MTAAPASAIARRGSLPSSESTPETIAATAQAASSDCIVRGFDATKIGERRYSTMIPTTDHTDCAMAHAAGGAEVAVCVIQLVKGHSASRPATPTNSSTDPTTSERTVQPGLVC